MNRHTLVLVGAVVLAVVATSAVMLLRTPDVDEQERAADRRDDTTVAELRQQVARLEARVRELEAARVAEDGRAGVELLTTALREPSPELDDLLAAAVARSESEEGERREAKRKDGDKEREAQTITAILEAVDAELDRWSEAYGISAAQVDDLKGLARRSVDRQTKAKAEGASPEELAAIEVETQGEVRRIVGDRVYAATERDRLHREARGGLFWVSAAVGGLSEEQNEQLDRAVEAGVEQSLSDVVRLRSEPMPQAEAAAILKRLERMQADAWADIRERILTEAQRRRIPGK